MNKSDMPIPPKIRTLVCATPVTISQAHYDPYIIILEAWSIRNAKDITY